jgi:hypothetical protein
VRFLRRHAAALSRLRGHQNCSSMVLDFGLHDQATDTRPWPSYHLPATLIELAGSFGIAIELSFYGPTRERSETKS